MSCQLFIQKQVFEELNDVVLYYENLQEGLGLSLLEEWENALDLLKDYPEYYPKKYKNFRQTPIKRFPYLIIFEKFDSDVIIFRFIHASKNPKKRFKP